MVNIRIYIENESEYWDKTVCLKTKMPSIPNVGDIVHIPHIMQVQLEYLAKESKTADSYFPKYYYGKNLEEFKDVEMDRRPSFGDAIFVVKKRYIPNKKYVDICLGTDN